MGAARMIRSGLLDSERVQKRTVPARWLFVSIALTADDLGLFEVSLFKLHRAAALPEKILPGLLKELAGADLIREYEAEGKRYAFIPRYGQRLRNITREHPFPPDHIVEGDLDAINKIKDLRSKLSATRAQGADDPPPNGSRSRPEVEVEEELEAKKKRMSKPAAPTLPPCPYEQIVELYHLHLDNLPKVVLREGKTWAKRKKAMADLWIFALTSKRSDGKRRATNAAEALAWVEQYFQRATNNDFIMGRTKPSSEHPNWKADFDFVLGEKGMRHVIEKTEERAAETT